jgi:hypothetical protein
MMYLEIVSNALRCHLDRSPTQAEVFRSTTGCPAIHR